ncbi:protein translocase subunit SecF [bacterium Unc6]|nr:protein translocase subunit SecF [bacterium Unc6]
MFRIVPKTNIDFLGKRKVAYTFSFLLLLTGIVSLIYHKGPNWGIEFTGGSLMQIHFNEAMDIGKARSILKQAGLQDAFLQQYERNRGLIIRIKGEGGNVSDTITEALKKNIGEGKFRVERTEEVGPVVGKAMQRKTLIAVIAAAIVLTMYIAFRFDFKFGVAATIATFHDVVAVVGIFSIMNKEITLQIVAALLTLAGYSMADTVVVFDRIRENMKEKRKEAKENIISIMNLSINEILSRSLMTSITTLLAVGALFFLGGEVIHDFTFALLIGIIIGTYSSVFIASPIVADWPKNR